jgi:DNA-binding transcriptional MerR regulator
MARSEVMDMRNRLLVGEAAARLGITPSGVRWLADTRLVRAIRTPSGVRLLSARDVERLRQEREQRSKQD